MSQPKSNRQWDKQMSYARVYGGGIDHYTMKGVQPLFWKQRERQHELKQHKEWMDWMDEMLTKTQESKDGQQV